MRRGDAYGHAIATGAVDGTELATFFVLPKYQRRGIGTALLALECAAREQGLLKLTVYASVTGASFYERSERRTGREFDGTAGPQIGMEKTFAT